MNEFTETYKSFSNRKLLKIIEETKSYQPAAIEAAHAELARRALSEEEIQSVQDELSAEKAKAEEKRQVLKTAENKAKAVGTEFLATINPIQTETLTTKRKINVIAIFFGLWSILTISREFYFIKFLFTDGNFNEWDYSVFAVLFPVILIPVAAILFWQRNQIGWILVSAFLVYAIGNAIIGIITDWQWYRMDANSLGSLQNDINEVLPSPNYIKYFILIAIFSGTLWVVSRVDIRAALGVDKKTALATILSTAALMLIIIFGLVM